jgi:hypothetical protein
MAWFKRFVDPIVVPDGRTLLTLRDAADYITALPKTRSPPIESRWKRCCWLPATAHSKLGDLTFLPISR